MTSSLLFRQNLQLDLKVFASIEAAYKVAFQQILF